jgi:hypothetical protein
MKRLWSLAFVVKKDYKKYRTGMAGIHTGGQYVANAL